MPDQPRRHVIDVIAGDGIGQEVVPAAIRCLDAVSARHGFGIVWRDHDWGSDRYRSDGRMMPADGLDQLADGDAIFLGAVGAPGVPDHVTLWGLLIPIRRAFLQYVNLRPVAEGTRTPDLGGSAGTAEFADAVLGRLAPAPVSAYTVPTPAHRDQKGPDWTRPQPPNHGTTGSLLGSSAEQPAKAPHRMQGERNVENLTE